MPIGRPPAHWAPIGRATDLLWAQMGGLIFLSKPMGIGGLPKSFENQDWAGWAAHLLLGLLYDSNLSPKQP